MHPNHPRYSDSIFYCASKEQPEFRHGGLVFTHGCNSLDVGSLARDLNIYCPKMVRMPMPLLKH